MFEGAYCSALVKRYGGKRSYNSTLYKHCEICGARIAIGPRKLCFKCIEGE